MELGSPGKTEVNEMVRAKVSGSNVLREDMIEQVVAAHFKIVALHVKYRSEQRRTTTTPALPNNARREQEV